jgi:cytidine deaminase
LSTQRVVDLIFGDRYITPTREEYGMFHAHASALRSSAPSRQVGAVLTGEDGEVISMGTNEVPKPGGGFVWEGEPGDYRDHKLPERRDPSLLRRRTLVADVLTSLSPWLDETKQQLIKDDIDSAVSEAWTSVLMKSQILDLIEFQRAEHAEAAALADAARRGISVKAATLFTTTYPCHLCAKEIVGARISRLVFLEPYPKVGPWTSTLNQSGSLIQNPRLIRNMSYSRPLAGFRPGGISSSLLPIVKIE